MKSRGGVRGGPLERPRVVVFDLDGTLFDSLPGVLRAIQHAMEPFACRPITMEIFPNLGGPPERFFPQLLHDPKDAPAALSRLDRYVAANGWSAEPYPRAVETVMQLARAGIATAVWTGRDRASTEALVRRHGLQHAFGTLVCGDDLPTHKPHPEGMRVILDRFGLTPDDAIFVGDSDVDVASGVASGVRTVLIQAGRLLDGKVRDLAWKVAARHADAYDIARNWAGLANAG